MTETKTDPPDEGAVIAAIAAEPAVAYDLLDFLAFELGMAFTRESRGGGDFPFPFPEAEGDGDLADIARLLAHLERELALPPSAGQSDEHERRGAATRVLLDHVRACLRAGCDILAVDGDADPESVPEDG